MNIIEHIAQMGKRERTIAVLAFVGWGLFVAVNVTKTLTIFGLKDKCPQAQVEVKK